MTPLLFQEIKITESQAKQCAQIVREYSWGMDYPVDPWDEMRRADFIVGCFDGEKLVGCASVTRVASPDGHDNGKPWFADAVVLPEYRRRGILHEMYSQCMQSLSGESVVFTCTDNPIMEKFFNDRGWKLDRVTTDESGGECKVFFI